jgi:hypothetical protein
MPLAQPPRNGTFSWILHSTIAKIDSWTCLHFAKAKLEEYLFASFKKVYGVLVSTSARISRSSLILSAVRGLLASDVGLNRIFPGMTVGYLFNPLHSQCQGQLFPGGRFDFE